MMESCSHRWRQVFEEEAFVGGCIPVGWRCLNCGRFVNQESVTPAGLPGTVTGEKELVGPHGGCGNCSDGSVYKRQIQHEDGTVTIERP